MSNARLTEQHITLLRNACVYWEDCETGAPGIDPKRPYGNSGVASDVAELLGLESARCPHCDEPLSERDDAALLAIHRQTEFALAVILKCHDVKPGLYERRGDQWVRVGE